MSSDNRLFWIWLAETLGIGNPDLHFLLERYEDPYDLYCAEEAEIERMGLSSEKTAAALANKSLKRASEILDLCQRLEIKLLPYASAQYPNCLRELKNAPVLLYYAGRIPDWDSQLRIGLVGTRKMSAYGMETAYKISYELAAAQAIVISGMAEGIDGVCAAAALRAGGMTVAVLGCGLDRAYPKHHAALMKQIVQEGLLLSEYPPGTPPMYYHFPVRNRIISGLSQGVVVVEAGIGSGSLITAKEAVVQGRDVFAIPANADGIGADGANGLLRDGAIFATDTVDILNRYQYGFAGNMRTDLVHKAAKSSKPDREYLYRIGVLRSDFAKQTANGEAVTAETEEPVSEYRAPRKDKSTSRIPLRQREYRAARENVAERVSHTGAPAASKKALPTKATKEIPASVTDPVQLAVLQAMPDREPITVDALLGLGHDHGAVLVALTMLEIMGLVQKLPGSAYQKA